MTNFTRGSLYCFDWFEGTIWSFLGSYWSFLSYEFIEWTGPFPLLSSGFHSRTSEAWALIRWCPLLSSFQSSLSTFHSPSPQFSSIESHLLSLFVRMHPCTKEEATVQFSSIQVLTHLLILNSSLTGLGFPIIPFVIPLLS